MYLTETLNAVQPKPSPLIIMGGDGNKIAEIKPDGTLEVADEHATEAASVFWAAVRGYVEASFAAHATKS